MNEKADSTPADDDKPQEPAGPGRWCPLIKCDCQRNRCAWYVELKRQGGALEGYCGVHLAAACTQGLAVMVTRIQGQLGGSSIVQVPIEQLLGKSN